MKQEATGSEKEGVDETPPQYETKIMSEAGDATEDGGSENEYDFEETVDNCMGPSLSSPNKYRTSDNEDDSDEENTSDNEDEDDKGDAVTDEGENEKNYSTEENTDEQSEAECGGEDEGKIPSQHRGSQPLTRQPLRKSDEFPETDGSSDDSGSFEDEEFAVDGQQEPQAEVLTNGAEEEADQHVVNPEMPPSGQVVRAERLEQMAKSNGKSFTKRHLDEDDAFHGGQQALSKRQKMTRGIGSATGLEKGAIGQAKSVMTSSSGNWPPLRSTKTFSKLSLAEQSRSLKDWMANVDDYVSVIQAGAIPVWKMSRFFKHINKHLGAVAETLDNVALATQRQAEHHKTAQEAVMTADVERDEIGELLGRFAPKSSAPAITQNGN
ncbi:hypothetical protein A1O3_00042 [Capronia epimyces CBS 606.96]|uniref:Uncharacterized protein n=1 Tax=Capronia epimyces CBS 606.96 TaxID=1182542 RepID=W9ZAF1_9EURO|nr:uncharacterized protein A1O3_00042 [Capronia epimyces CBS 606.96]EXJ91494.1 hypothetical protein A1O3_00042 [Capronia epimyces CBS 606.96]